jgi:hypothetical protein
VRQALCAAAVPGLLVIFLSPVASLPGAAGGPTFVDVARQAGLNHQTIFGARDKNTYILETTGTGVAFLDFDGDGVLDLCFTNGRTLETPGHSAT